MCAIDWKEDKWVRCTHPLKATGRDMSEHGKKVNEQRGLTVWGPQKEGHDWDTSVYRKNATK